jgi:hypothetical protein
VWVTANRHAPRVRECGRLTEGIGIVIFKNGNA